MIQICIIILRATDVNSPMETGESPRKESTYCDSSEDHREDSFKYGRAWLSSYSVPISISLSSEMYLYMSIGGGKRLSSMSIQ